jgi:ABC-type phosphate transport system permease subunit
VNNVAIAIYTVNSVNLLAAVLTFFYCAHFVWKFIVKQCINKKFINMFYVVAFLMLGADFAIITAVYLIDYQDQNDSTMAYFLSSANVIVIIHSICYVAFVLLMICTIFHIKIGLSLQLKEFADFKTAQGSMWCNYLSCLLVLSVTIGFEVLAYLEDIVPLALTIYYLVLGLLLLFGYLFGI